MSAMSDKLKSSELYFGGTYASTIQKGIVELLAGYEFSSSSSESSSDSFSESSDSSTEES